MTKKEAVRKVLRHEEVQPVPYSIKFTVEAKEKMIAKYGADFDPILDTGSYVVASHTNNGWEEVEPGHFKDYFRVIWNKTQDRTLGVVDHPPITEPTFDGFEFPDPNHLPVYDFIRADQQKYPDHFHMVSIGFTLFERAWSLVGMEELMMYFITDPGFVHELLKKITEYNIAVIRKAVALGVDCVHFGDDWGSQHGPLISPAMWRDFIKEPFRETCTAAKEAGLLVSLHCCGNVEAIMEDIVECGVDVFDPFQPEAMDVWKLREQYRGRMAFWGGLSVQQTMPYGTPNEVRAETRRLISKMAPGGGYILAPAHALTGDVPLKNIEAFLEEAGTPVG
jgi:uroporphyrinogen decarboxylase